jgi:hypothetical protein
MHKTRSIEKWFVETGVEELDWPSVLSSTPLKPFGINWNANCESGLNHLKSVPDLTSSWLNGRKYRSNIPTASEKPSQKSGGC